MAWLDCCEHLEVNYSGLHRRQGDKAALLHTNGGGTANGSLRPWWAQHASGALGAGNMHIGAQFQVKRKGKPEQYTDSDLVLYHAYSASEFAVGIETEDDSKPSTPWNDNQIEGIVAILHELHVPAKMLTRVTPGDGVGYHMQFPEWNKTGHECAGSVRDKQIHTEVLPELASRYGKKKPPVVKPPVHPNPHAGTPKWFSRVLQFHPGQHPGHVVVTGGAAYQFGADVRAVQRAVGPRSTVDGLYGPATADRVRIFQRKHGLVIDGIVGPRTARKIG